MRDKQGLTLLNRIINKLPWRSKYEPLFGFTEYHRKLDLSYFKILKSENHRHLFYKRKQILKWLG